MNIDSNIKAVEKNLSEVKKIAAAPDKAKIASYEDKLATFKKHAATYLKNNPSALSTVEGHITNINKEIAKLKQAYGAKDTLKKQASTGVANALDTLFSKLTQKIAPALIKTVQPPSFQEGIKNNLVITTAFKVLNSAFTVLKNDPLLKGKRALITSEINMLQSLQKTISDKSDKEHTYLNKNAREEILEQYGNILTRVIQSIARTPMDKSSQHVLKQMSTNLQNYVKADAVWSTINNIKGNVSEQENDMLTINSYTKKIKLTKEVKNPSTKDMLNKALSPLPKDTPKKKIVQTPKPNINPSSKPTQAPKPSATPSSKPSSAPSATVSQKPKNAPEKYQSELDDIKKEFGLNLQVDAASKSSPESVKKALQTLQKFLKNMSTDMVNSSDFKDNMKQLQQKNTAVYLSLTTTSPFVPEKIHNILRINPTKFVYLGGNDEANFSSAVKILQK